LWRYETKWQNEEKTKDERVRNQPDGSKAGPESEAHDSFARGLGVGNKPQSKTGKTYEMQIIGS